MPFGWGAREAPRLRLGTSGPWTNCRCARGIRDASLRSLHMRKSWLASLDGLPSSVNGRRGARSAEPARAGLRSPPTGNAGNDVARRETDGDRTGCTGCWNGASGQGSRMRGWKRLPVAALSGCCAVWVLRSLVAALYGLLRCAAAALCGCGGGGAPPGRCEGWDALGGSPRAGADTHVCHATPHIARTKGTNVTTFS
jgi:hypothetical protein